MCAVLCKFAATFEMNRGVVALIAACGVAGGTVWTVLARQRSERERMHQGVLRDIASEAQERAAAAQTQGGDCEGGVCDLKATRFRDPASGKVYAPGQK